MKNQRLHSGQLILLLLAISTMSAQNHKWRVNNSPNDEFIRNPSGIGRCDYCFNNLQDAVAALQVASHDTIYVEPTSESYGDIVLEKPLTLIGVGYYLADNENSTLQYTSQNSIIKTITINPNAHGTILEGLALGRESFSSITIKADDVLIKRCDFPAINLSSNVTNLDNITITQSVGGYIQNTSFTLPVTNLNIMNNYLESAVFMQGQSGNFFQNIVLNNVDGFSGITYENNIFINGLIQPHDNTVENVKNNTFTSANWVTNSAGTTNEVEGTTTIFQTYPFTYDADYLTKPSCNTCQHGFPWPTGPGTLKGVFGGATPYVPGGIPNVPSIYNLNAPAQISVGQTANITVSTRSNNHN